MADEPRISNPEFKAWLQRHLDSCPRSDWPTTPELYAAWKRRILATKCDLETAMQATDRVAEHQPKYLTDHIDAICDAIFAIYRERDARRGTADNLLERAARGDELNHGEVAEVAKLCRDCPSCSGNGIAVRHSRTDIRKTLTVHCRCTYGQWIRARCLKTAPDAARRIPSLVDSPEWDDPRNGGPGVALEPAYAGHHDDDGDAAF